MRVVRMSEAFDELFSGEYAGIGFVGGLSPSALLSEAALAGVEDALTGDALRTQARLACSEAASGGGSRAASAAAARKMTDVSATEASIGVEEFFLHKRT